MFTGFFFLYLIFWMIILYLLLILSVMYLLSYFRKVYYCSFFAPAYFLLSGLGSLPCDHWIPSLISAWEILDEKSAYSLYHSMFCDSNEHKIIGIWHQMKHSCYSRLRFTFQVTNSDKLCFKEAGQFMHACQDKSQPTLDWEEFHF